MNFNESNQSFRVGFGDSYAIDDFDKLTNRPKYNSNPMTHDTNIPEVKTVAWDAAYTDRHTHSNKSVLDGITGALVSAWNAAYTALHGHSNKAVIDDISAADVSSWNGKYAKPAGGIPSTDMTSAVQTSLGKADTALQSETYTGTVTSVGVSMNGASKGTVTTSGVIDLGTVLTEHQTLSDLGVTASATELNYVDGVTSAIQTQIDGKLATSLKGSANGLAELDATGKVPSAQLPSYVDDVLEYDSIAQFPATGESGKIYVAKDTNKTYRWGGSAYVEISPSLALGETSSTAYRGDRGKTAYDHSQATGNPHGTTLGNLGVTATASELNVLDGITASTTELNYVDGVTSGIQGQLNSASTEISNLQRDAHTHSNKSILDAITQAIVNGWNTASTWVSTNGASVLSRLTALETLPEVYTITPPSGWNGYIKYCKSNGVVTVILWLYGTPVREFDNEMGFMPTGFRPIAHIREWLAPTAGYRTSTYTGVVIAIEPSNGRIMLYTGDNVDTAYNYYANFSYIAER